MIITATNIRFDVIKARPRPLLNSKVNMPVKHSGSSRMYYQLSVLCTSIIRRSFLPLGICHDTDCPFLYPITAVPIGDKIEIFPTLRLAWPGNTSLNCNWRPVVLSSIVTREFKHTPSSGNSSLFTRIAPAFNSLSSCSAFLLSSEKVFVRNLIYVFNRS